MNNYEQFEIDDENNKKNKKYQQKNKAERKYKITIAILILINIIILIVLLKTKFYKKENNSNTIIDSNNFLSFLLVSDIHDNVTSLEMLLSKAKSKKYDYTLYLGDMVKMTPGEQNSTKDASKYEQRMTQYLQKLETISPVLYIPGNNEPYTIYEKNAPKLTQISSNIHNNFIKIKKDLYIAGIGGCTPILNGGKYDKNIIPFSTLNTSNVIQNGFPYNLPQYGENNYKKSDEWFGNDIRNILNKIKKDAESNGLNNKYQVILISHEGPLYSWTNAQQQLGTGEHWLYLGSMELEKILINDENLILDIHGHIHPSRGIVTMVPGKTVINPGAIINGFYGELNVKKSEDKWIVNSMNLLDL